MSTRTAKIARIALAAAITLGGAVSTAVVAQPAAYAAGTSSVDGKISRSEIISRAQYWLGKSITYDQNGSYADSSGRYYRTDCSGYVDMAWHLGSAPNTDALVGYSNAISFDSLKPGDILDSALHVILFEKWDDPAHNTFSYYSFGSTPVKHITGMPRGGDSNGNFDSHPVGTYTPRSYVNVVDDVPVNNTVHLVDITPDGGLHNTEGNFSAGSWSGWSDMGASAIKEVTSAATGSVNRIFAIGGDSHIYENDGDYAAGKWSGWFQLAGSPTATAISASSFGSTVHLAIVGTDGQLYNSDGDYAAGRWNGWTGHGGTNLKHVTSASTANNVNHIFVIDSSNQVKEIDADYGAGAWGNWAVAGPTGGFTGIDVTASASGDTVHLGAIGTDGNWYNAEGNYDSWTWSGWSNMGGGGLKRITSATANNVNHVFAVNSSNRLVERDGDYNTGTWNSWAEPSGGADSIGATASFTS